MRKILKKSIAAIVFICFCMNPFLVQFINANAQESELVIDNGGAGYSEEGAWKDSGVKGYNSTASRYSRTENSKAMWKTKLSAGKYKVYVYKIVAENNSAAQSYEINCKDGKKTAAVDFTAGASEWTLLGEYNFGGTGEEGVILTCKKGEYARADAVKFVGAGASSGTPVSSTPVPTTVPTPTPVPKATAAPTPSYASTADESVSTATSNTVGISADINPSAEAVTVDNLGEYYSETGTWQESGKLGYNHTKTRYSKIEGSTAIWKPKLEAGKYKVFIYRIVLEGNSKSQNYEIAGKNGKKTANVDFAAGDNGFVFVGEYEFGGQGEEYVKLICKKDELVRADAVRFEGVIGGDGICVRINGKNQKYDQLPVVMNGRTLVPLRGIFEALGAEVKWDEATSTITATKDDVKVVLKIGSVEAYKDNNAIKLEQAPVVVNDRTMVPVRFVSESLGAEVQWTEATKTVDIYVAKTDGVLTQIPYGVDPSNRAGWWSPLEVNNNEVYMAFDGLGSTEESHKIQLARRDANGVWSLMNCYMDPNGTVQEYQNDSGHKQPSIAFDGSGRLHLFGSLHTTPWVYYRNTGKDDALLDHSSEMPDGNTTYTYPVVKSAPNGDLYLIVRGDEFLRTDEKKREGVLYRWDNAKETWSRIGAFASENNRAIYPDDVQIDAKGDVHILYEWAVFPSDSMRHKTSYIKYSPSTGKWYNHADKEVSVPVNSSNADVIQDFAAGEEWKGANEKYTGPAVVTGKMDVDSDGVIRVAYRHREVKDGNYKVKLARSVNGSPWSSEEVYSTLDTTASIDITYDGKDEHIYFVARKDTGYEAMAADKTADGTYKYEVLAPGKSITHISALHNSGTDYIYLMEFNLLESAQGQKEQGRIYFRTR